MHERAEEVITAARSRVGVPFRHHFKPENLCNRGRVTYDQCMTRGMDQNGYDCSGLVIASLCEVLRISPTTWPKNRRHAWQMQDLAVQESHEPGDVLLFENVKQSRFHPLVFSESQSVIHASGRHDAVVEEPIGEALRTSPVVHVIPLGNLVELIR